MNFFKKEDNKKRAHAWTTIADFSTQKQGGISAKKLLDVLRKT